MLSKILQISKLCYIAFQYWLASGKLIHSVYIPYCHQPPPPHIHTVHIHIYWMCHTHHTHRIHIHTTHAHTELHTGTTHAVHMYVHTTHTHTHTHHVHTACTHTHTHTHTKQFTPTHCTYTYHTTYTSTLQVESEDIPAPQSLTRIGQARQEEPWGQSSWHNASHLRPGSFFTEA